MDLPSYVDDLLCGLYDNRQVNTGIEREERREQIGKLFNRVSVVLEEVAVKRGLRLVEDKEVRLILYNRSGRQRRGGVAEKVKWLGVILDE